MNLFVTAEFLTTAVEKKQFPETSFPEFVMAGRSNVGKSSLINALTHKKALAYVGKRPGKTRYINFYQIQERLMLVDVPGYGYAQRSRSEMIQYGKMMDDYFELRKVNGVMLVIDCRHGLTEDDEDMREFVESKKLPLLIVATKSDKLNHSKRLAIKKELSETYNQDVILFSSLNKSGLEEIENWCKKYI